MHNVLKLKMCWRNHIAFSSYERPKVELWAPKNIFFSKVAKFVWKIRNQLNRKENEVSDFYFSSYGHVCSKNCQFSMNFHDNSRNRNRISWKLFFIRFSTLRIFHESGIKTKGGGVCIYFVETEPKYFLRRIFFLCKKDDFF